MDAADDDDDLQNLQSLQGKYYRVARGDGGSVMFKKRVLGLTE